MRAALIFRELQLLTIFEVLNFAEVRHWKLHTPDRPLIDPRSTPDRGYANQRKPMRAALIVRELQILTIFEVLNFAEVRHWNLHTPDRPPIDPRSRVCRSTETNAGGVNF